MIAGDLRRKMADEINCFTAEDLSELAMVKLETLDYWRKHGKGPKSIRFGTAHLYPKSSVIEFVNAMSEGPSDEYIRRVIK
ncbi:hypothetical protein D3C76_1368580 [compost metagenome]